MIFLALLMSGQTAWQWYQIEWESTPEYVGERFGEGLAIGIMWWASVRAVFFRERRRWFDWVLAVLLIIQSGYGLIFIGYGGNYDEFGAGALIGQIIMLLALVIPAATVAVRLMRPPFHERPFSANAGGGSLA